MRVAGKTVTSDLLDSEKNGDEENVDANYTDDDSVLSDRPTLEKKLRVYNPPSLFWLARQAVRDASSPGRVADK